MRNAAFFLLLLLLPRHAVAAASAEPRRSGSDCLTANDAAKAKGPIVCSLGTNRQRFPVSQVSRQQANELFEIAKNIPGISYGYVDDGCYARAHAIAVKLEEKGILVGKIFTTGELAALRPAGAPMLRQKDGSEVPDRYVRWNYHVAPFVMIDTGGTREVYVIDPSLFQNVVPVQDWMKAQLVTADSYLNETQTSDRHAYMLGNPDSWRLTHSNDPRRLLNGIVTTPLSVRREGFSETDLSHTERTNRNYNCITNPATCAKRSNPSAR